MLRFAFTRVRRAPSTLLIVAVAVFVLICLAPGDPARLMMGELAGLVDLRARLGLDQSLPVQVGKVLASLVVVPAGMIATWKQDSPID